MSGTVLEINAVIDETNDRHALAVQISNIFDQYNSARTEKMDEWRELRNYLFATSTRDTSNAALPWKNSTTVPKLTQLRDNLHANYMAALFSNERWFRWVGADASSETKEKKEAIENYMLNKVRSSGFRSLVSDLLYDYIDYGNVIADVDYVIESHIDPETKEELVTYEGPKAFRISPYDIVFNIGALSFADTPKISRSIVTTGELRGIAEKRGYAKDIIDEAVKLRVSYSNFSHADMAKNDGYTVDGFGTLYDYFMSGYAEILEFEGSLHTVGGELMENKIITILDRKYVLRIIDNPSWIGKSTKVHCAWRPRPDNLWGMGPLDNLVGMQYRIDHLENIRADLFDLIAHPPLKIRGNVEEFEWEPFAEINLMDEQSDVEILKVDSAALTADQQIAILEQRMEELAGAPKQAMGIRTPGEKTAFEVQSLDNASSRIFQEKIAVFETQVLEPLLNNMLEVARRYLSTKDLIRVMDDDLGVATFMEITKEDITAKGRLFPVGSRHWAATNQLIQNLNGVFNSQLGQIIAPHISAKALAKMVEDAFSWESYGLIGDNVGVLEQQETQSLAQQGQEQLQMEALTPAIGE